MNHEINEGPTFPRILNVIDHILFYTFVGLLLIVIATSAKVNIFADSVDYYAMLQWVTPEKEKPIVSNVHFAEQRSPGYSLLSLIPYSLLTIFVEPFVTTETIREYSRSEFPRGTDGRRGGSEMMLLPPTPLHIKDLFFRDYYLPMEDSWFQWKLTLSLLLTSYSFLFIGIWANAKVLTLYSQSGKCLSIIPATILTASTFIRNIIDLPLFATLTVYGLGSLLLLFIWLSVRSKKSWQIVASGLLLGLLVLTRLELGILAIILVGFFFFLKQFRFLALFSLGGIVGFLALIVYDLSLFGTPIYLGIMRGDINTLGLNLKYIYENLFHPGSGILFWTPLLIPGLVFLLFAKDSILRVLGASAFVLIIFYTLRVPIMYSHIGEGIIEIGGIPVTVPGSSEEMRHLIRFDIGRYVAVMIPFSAVGIRIAIDKVQNLLKKTNTSGSLPYCA
ncbi:MAG: hypothetical protein ACUVQT_04435 [bacterium]